jgi:DUF1009 family protein
MMNRTTANDKPIATIGHIEVPFRPPIQTVLDIVPPGPIGMIAGNGLFPQLFLDAAVRKGFKVVIAAHQGETSAKIEDWGMPVKWIRIGQVSPIFDFFHSFGVRFAAFVGGIKKPRLFDLRPDWKGIRILARVAANHDDQVLRALAEEFEKEGISIVPSTLLLPNLTAGEGVLGTVPVKEEDWADIRLGFQVGTHLGSLDVGQCVVVHEKVVLALEAIEGTNETIRRGSKYAKGAVVVKLAKPNQDLRFDLPAVGPETLSVMAEVGARVLAIESGKTLILDAGSFFEKADASGIAIVGVKWN